MCNIVLFFFVFLCSNFGSAFYGILNLETMQCQTVSSTPYQVMYALAIICFVFLYKYISVTHCSGLRVLTSQIVY